MFTHPGPLGQLAAEHHRHMLTEARQRALRHQHGRPSSKTPDIALKITRRLATAITRASAVAAQSPGPAWVVGRTSWQDPQRHQPATTDQPVLHARSVRARRRSEQSGGYARGRATTEITLRDE
jgi:hypothetical protein